MSGTSFARKLGKVLNLWFVAMILWIVLGIGLGTADKVEDWS